MTVAAIRQQLHQFIDVASNKDIEAVYQYIEASEMGIPQANSVNSKNDKWEDSAFIAEMERRATAFERGNEAGYSWEEVKTRARKLNK